MKEFLSYGKQWIELDDIRAVSETLQSDFLTQGPKVTEFEEAVCRYTGARYCVALANGTAALHLAVASLGIDPGMEGITSTNTFVASANAMLYNNLVPVLGDIDPKTYNLLPQEFEKRLKTKTKLVIPVHFAGQPADMRSIAEIAYSNDVFVIEDAAHAIGSKYANGGMVGSSKYSDLTIFSFHPVKTITTGEGGAITTNDTELYKKLCHLRTHGITKDPVEMGQNPGPWYYEMQMLGFNYRLSDIQAALGLSQLKKIESFAQRRHEIKQRYNAAFSGIDWLKIPYEEPGVHSVFHLYVLQIDFDAIEKTRAEVMKKLASAKIGTQVHYIPVHLQPYYQKNLGYRPGDFPNAETYYSRALSIPLYPKMTDEQVDYVIGNILGLKYGR
jgi:perosamine synthetase